MAKVLLVIDDYQELVSMEALLRKLGFDVVGVANEYSISEQFITFHPDILIVYGKDVKVSTLSVGQKVANSKSFKGRVVLIFPEGKKPRLMELADLRMDVILEGPVEEQRLVTMLAALCDIPLDQLSSKLTRSYEGEGASSQSFQGKGSKEEAVRVGDSGKYDEMFKDDKLPPRTFTDRATLRRKWSEARAQQSATEAEELLELKKDFLRALFRKDDK